MTILDTMRANAEALRKLKKRSPSKNGLLFNFAMLALLALLGLIVWNTFR